MAVARMSEPEMNVHAFNIQCFKADQQPLKDYFRLLLLEV